MSDSFVGDIYHHLGISFITLAFVYIFIITILNSKAFLPFWFYLINGIGVMFIFIHMLGQQRTFVYYNEAIMLIISVILAIHSFTYYKK